MSLSQCISSFLASDDLGYVAELGDFLRAEDARNSQQVYEIIPSICDKYHTACTLAHSQETKLSLLRVLVNLVASNDRNRECLIQIRSFWDDLLGPGGAGGTDGGCPAGSHTEPEWQRAFIFLTQFTRDSEKVAYYAKKLAEFGVDSCIVDRIGRVVRNGEAGDESLEGELEILLEIVKATSEDDAKNADRLAYLTAAAEFLVAAYSERKSESHEEEEEDEEDNAQLELVSELIYKLTLAEDMRGGAQLIRLLELVLGSLGYEAVSLCSSVRAKRQLFASCGNISSMPSVDNFAMVSKCIEYMLHTEASSNGYLFAASAIILGNCVSSAETQDRLLGHITEKFGGGSSWIEEVARFIATSLNDVVQYQAVHLLVNGINAANSLRLLLLHTFTVNLYKITKVIKDNSKYYPEINRIVNKFVKKALRLSENTIDVFAGPKVEEFEVSANTGQEAKLVARDTLQQLWSLFEKGDNDDYEISLLLVQKSVQNGYVGSLANSNLVKELVKPVDNIAIEVLLEKLKTLAMFFQLANVHSVVSMCVEDVETDVYMPYAEFMDSLRLALQPDKTPPAILVNNSKFVAAVTNAFIEGQSGRGKENEKGNDNDSHLLPPVSSDYVSRISQTCADILSL